jgi:3-deoxy-D-manno-octulosonic-acid transferase
VIFDRAVLGFYNAFLLLAAPVLLLKKAVKFGRRGHRHEWDMARWKAPVPVQGEGLRVVFVALSWGEVGILNEITRRLESDIPNLKIIWSIRDERAQQMARKAFANRSTIPMPFDFVVPTRNWLGQVRPDVLVIVEKFWWPNLVWGAKLRGAQVVLINGRSRGREKTRYKWLSGLQKWTLRAFDTLVFESPAQIERVRDVLPRGAKVSATGNVKFAFEAPSPPPHAEQLTEWLESRSSDAKGPLPLLIAGSTSPIDDEWSLQAWQQVRKTMPCALLIAPRRLERTKDIVAKLRAQNYEVSLRSKPTPGSEILILDSLGELAYAYQFGVAAYVGGSVEGRGHNIIEPLAWGIPVSYGPIRGDFESAQMAAEEREVGVRLRSIEDLVHFWKKALSDKGWCQQVETRAAELIEAQKGALDAVVSTLKSQILESKAK